MRDIGFHTETRLFVIFRALLVSRFRSAGSAPRGDSSTEQSARAVHNSQRACSGRACFFRELFIMLATVSGSFLCHITNSIFDLQLAGLRYLWLTSGSSRAGRGLLAKLARGLLMASVTPVKRTRPPESRKFL